MSNNEMCNTIQYQRGSLSILDQLKLPNEIIYIHIHTVDDAWKAIHTMTIRGASGIALCGILSVAVELHNSRSKFNSISSVIQFVTDQLNYLTTARPTTMNMTNIARTIIDYLIQLNKNESNSTLYINQLLEFIELFLQRDLDDNRSISQYGADILSKMIFNRTKLTLLTHCNTATMGFGTGLGIIRQLSENNLLKIVYFTETRPYNQDSGLTAYELIHARIPHMMICDSMVAHLMQTQSIDGVIVGADHVTANGDTIHQIGTYQLAILARHHDIPFYVVTSTTAVNLTKRTGNEIFIEQRPSSEMITIQGINIAAEGVHVWNPAFDITPASLITGIITQYGVFKPDEIEEKFRSFQLINHSPFSS